MGAGGCGTESWSRCGNIESAVLASAPTNLFGHQRGGDDPNVTGVRSPLVKEVKEFKAVGSAPHSPKGQEGFRAAMKELHQAARAGHLKRAVEAISKGADVRGQTLRGQSALMLAAGSSAQGSLETVRFLLESMSDLDAQDEKGWTALLHACRNNRLESVKLLLESAAYVKARASDGKTAVMLAALDGATDLAMVLVDKQASLNAVDHSDWSALLYACESGRCDLVKALIKKQADAKARARDGTTALMVAAERGYLDIGEALQKKGVSPNSRNLVGDTALLLSLRADQLQFAEWLVNAGADVTLRNKANEDATEVAEKMGAGFLRIKLELKSRGGAKD